MNKRAKKTLSIAGKLSLRLAVASILCVILYISMNVVIPTAFFSQPIGYQVYDVSDPKNPVQIGEDYIYAKDDKPITAEDLDLKKNEEFISLREVPSTVQTVFSVITQIMLLILFGIFPYHIMWEFGNRDDTNVRYRGQRPDRLRGLKIGFLAILPFAVVWVCLFIVQFFLDPGYLMDAFRLFHSAWWVLIDWITNKGNDTAWWRLLAFLPTYLFVPLLSSVSYHLGSNQFSIAEFLTFKKKDKDDKNQEI